MNEKLRRAHGLALIRKPPHSREVSRVHSQCIFSCSSELCARDCKSYSFVSFDTIHAAPTSCCLRYSIGCNDCKTCATLCNTQENAHQPDARTYAVAPPAAAAATVRYQRRSSRQPQACRADDDGMGRYACGEATGAQIWHGSQHICIACTVLSMTRALMLCATIPAWS